MSLTNERLEEIRDGAGPSTSECIVIINRLLAAEAQLAELGREKPIFQVDLGDGWHDVDKVDYLRYSGDRGVRHRKVYAHPVPPAASQLWFSVANGQLPDANSEKRVCAYTPTEHGDLRYRSIPASLFKAVCSDATHWHYFTSPEESTASQQNGLTEKDLKLRAAAEKYLEACKNQPLHDGGYIDRVVRPITEQFHNRANAWDVLELLKRLENTSPASQPVAWQWFYLKQWHVTNDPERARDVAEGGVEVQPLGVCSASQPYTVPDDLRKWIDDVVEYLKSGLETDGELEAEGSIEAKRLLACRAAMLQHQPQSSQQNIPENIPAGNSPVVPDGWVLVPIEPTWEMLSEDGCKEHHKGQECLHHDNRRRIWRAMLAAAPQHKGE